MLRNMCRSRLLSHVYVTPFVAPQPRSRFVRLLAASERGADGSFKRRAVRRAGRAADTLGRATGAVRGREGDREVRREIAAGRSAQEQGGRALAAVRDSDAAVHVFIRVYFRRSAKSCAICRPSSNSSRGSSRATRSTQCAARSATSRPSLSQVMTPSATPTATTALHFRASARSRSRLSSK